MDISLNLNATIQCLDGVAGRVVGVVLHPNGNFVTQLIMRRSWLDMEERLVALRHVKQVTYQHVYLTLTKAQLGVQPARYSTTPFPLSSLLPESLPWLDDLPALGDSMVFTRHSAVKRGMQTVENGTAVYALDGYIGRISAYKIDSHTYEIVNVAVDSGALWWRQCIQLSPDMITCYRADGAQLRTTKRKLRMRAKLKIA